MRCAHCGEEITSKPCRQDDEVYCSLHCAYAAEGVDLDQDDDEYYDEVPVNSLTEEEEEEVN